MFMPARNGSSTHLSYRNLFDFTNQTSSATVCCFCSFVYSNLCNYGQLSDAMVFKLPVDYYCVFGLRDI